MSDIPADFRADAERIRELLLEAPLFAQFRDRPECLRVSIEHEGFFYLRLDNFPGLDTKPLTPRAFGTLAVEGVELSGGSIFSGGAEGIALQYRYALPSHDLDGDADPEAPSGPRM